MELSDELYDRIEELSETGNEAMESEDYAKAISCFQEALDILPEPKEDWEAYLWLVGSIGDAHFMMVQDRHSGSQDRLRQKMQGSEGHHSLSRPERFDGNLCRIFRHLRFGTGLPAVRQYAYGGVRHFGR